MLAERSIKNKLWQLTDCLSAALYWRLNMYTPRKEAHMDY